MCGKSKTWHEIKCADKEGKEKLGRHNDNHRQRKQKGIQASFHSNIQINYKRSRRSGITKRILSVKLKKAFMLLFNLQKARGTANKPRLFKEARSRNELILTHDYNISLGLLQETSFLKHNCSRLPCSRTLPKDFLAQGQL